MASTRRVRTGPGPRRGFRRKRTIEGEADTVAVKRVAITSVAPPNLEPTQTYPATAEVFGWSDINGDEGYDWSVVTGESVRWFSSNTSVFTVNASGVVTAQGVGTATLIADVDGYRDTQSVVVTNPQNSVASIALTPNTTITLPVSGTTTIEARTLDASGNVVVGQTVTWETSDNTKVTVSADSGDENHRTTATAVATGGAPQIRAVCGEVTSPWLSVSVTSATDITYFADKFDTGARKGLQGGYGWNSVKTKPAVRVSNLNPYPGDSYSLWLTWGEAQQGSTQGFQLGANLTEVYIGFYLYVPDGNEGTGSVAYDHWNNPTTSDNHKLLRLWDSYAGGVDASYSAQRVKTGGNFLPRSGTGPGSRLDMGSQIMWQNASNSTVYYSGGGGDSNFIQASDFGTWIKCQFRAKLASGPDANDGAVEWRRNGVTVFSNTALDFWDHQNLGNWFRNGYVMGAANGGFRNYPVIMQVARFRIGNSWTACDPDATTGW